MLHKEDDFSLVIPDAVITAHIVTALDDFKYVVTLAQVNKRFKKLIENSPHEYNIRIGFEDGPQKNISGTYNFIFKEISQQKKEIALLNDRLEIYNNYTNTCINFYPNSEALMSNAQGLRK